MDHEVPDAQSPGKLDERLQVGKARVHAAVGDQADQMDALGAGQRAHDCVVLAEHAIDDGVVDACEVLAYDGAGAEVEVADLRVAHLALRQSDRAAAGGQCGVRVGAPERVEDRRVGKADRIARPRLGEPPAVEDHQAGAGQRQLRHVAASAI